ncbi:NUDIX domain-containing protein [Fictibacillus sp. KU28468]|uniref:NUDIX domain-containing protein n=1 Tax=Fictibacillus sp. KU28468 TaxID=2991053 RepID=UPI00223D9BA1|nr:NUDIX domain-containing protein [Fictibacillus sp. KU28468]UZJ77907.1 NUDIX domain-containing protein [Fictibacillus sp. KU28468]
MRAIKFEKQFVTAGIFVFYKGLFPFQIGPTRKGDQLGVVRLGGHREGNETPIETAVRELHEESGMNVKIIHSPVTYHTPSWNYPEIKVRAQDSQGMGPVLIKGVNGEYSVMYFGESMDKPVPSSEAKAIVLLKPADIVIICSRTLTFGEYIARNGIVVEREKMDRNLNLVPFPQLRFLSRLLNDEPEWLKGLFNMKI